MAKLRIIDGKARRLPGVGVVQPGQVFEGLEVWLNHPWCVEVVDGQDVAGPRQARGGDPQLRQVPLDALLSELSARGLEGPQDLPTDLLVDALAERKLTVAQASRLTVLTEGPVSDVSQDVAGGGAPSISPSPTSSDTMDQLVDALNQSPPSASSAPAAPKVAGVTEPWDQWRAHHATLSEANMVWVALGGVGQRSWAGLQAAYEASLT